jgi:hypothetical protein
MSLPWVIGSHDMNTIQAEIARQASMIGYLDSFWAFALTGLVVLPLILLVRWKR